MLFKVITLPPGKVHGTLNKIYLRRVGTKFGWFEGSKTMFAVGIW